MHIIIIEYAMQRNEWSSGAVYFTGGHHDTIDVSAGLQVKQATLQERVHRSHLAMIQGGGHISSFTHSHRIA